MVVKNMYKRVVVKKMYKRVVSQKGVKVKVWFLRKEFK